MQKLILLLLFINTYFSLDLIIKQGSVFKKSPDDNSFRRIFHSGNLEDNTSFQTSGDFRGAIASNNGFYSLNPSSYYLYSQNNLYKRDNTEYQFLINLGVESDQQMPNDSEKEFYILAKPAILLSRARTFENRELAGKIHLSDEDYIKTPNVGMSKIVIDDKIEILVSQNSELSIKKTSLSLFRGSIFIKAKPKTRFEVLSNLSLASLLGEKLMLTVKQNQSEIIALAGITRVESRRANNQQKALLLKPQESLIVINGNLAQIRPLKREIIEPEFIIEPDINIANNLSNKMQEAINITNRANNYRQAMEEGLDYIEEVVIEEAVNQEEAFVSGLDRLISQNYPSHLEGQKLANPSVARFKDRQYGYELGKAKKALDEKVLIQKKGIQLGVDPAAIRQGLSQSDSQLAQMRIFLIQRERELSRIDSELNRIVREENNLSRKIAISETRGIDPAILARLRQDKQDLLLKMSSLKNNQVRLNQQISNTRKELNDLLAKADLQIRYEDAYLKSSRDQIR